MLQFQDRREWCTGTPRPFYRAWSNDTYNSDHLYSASLDEINRAAPRYKREQDCCLVFTDRNQTVQQLVPLYRLWNSAHWDHFYTIDAAERANAIAAGFNDEGIAAYSPDETDARVVPFYRIWNHAHWDHFYTVSLAERNAALATGLFDDEGILGYVMTEAGCGSWPLYRLYRDDAYTTFDHFYTISVKERDAAIASGKYRDEGIAAWVWPTCDLEPCSP
ncbi:hypothetical protein AURDEDRAFT_61846 [Auricularia subglabra TFB-10046 SS5]|nr:hypothetical protein AURDEDRAFT_61846 [Auricularia subglabra TFB-10046 SS5]